MTKLKNILVAAASLVIFTNITNAQQAVNASYSVNFEEPLSVKYLGNDGEYLLFKVTLQSKNPANTKFAIDDKNEGELYSSGIDSGYTVRTIKIEKRDDQVLNFKLSLGKKTYLKSFSVNTSVVEKTSVAEGDITKL